MFILTQEVLFNNDFRVSPFQVQMDDHKVACGLEDGMVCVYDQRNAQKLWEFHNRFVLLVPMQSPSISSATVADF